MQAIPGDIASALADHAIEHARLRQLVDDLLEGLDGPQAQQVSEKVTKFIAEHVTTHFADEEKTMQRLGYPDLPRHKGEHAELMDYVDNVKTELVTTGDDPEMLVVSNKLLCNWLLTHFGTSDRDFEMYLRKST